MTKALVLSAVAIMATACAKHNDNSNPPAVADVRASECQKFTAGLPSDFVQGKIEVPEDYAKPDGLKTHVFYYGRVGSDNFPTIVFFNGGPGGDSHTSFDALQPVVTESPDTQKALPILYIDQRGTGCSDDYPPNPNTVADLQRFSHYGSTEIVKDAEVVRKKLQGDQKWKVFGQSYGGLVGKRYMQIAPQGMRSLHVHGLSSDNDETLWLAERLTAQHRLATSFFSQYPGDLQVFKKIEGLLNDKTCFGTKVKTCGKKIIYGTTELLGFHIYWPYLHAYLTSFLNGNDLNPDKLNSYLDMLSGDSSSGLGPTIITWVDEGVAGFTYAKCHEVFEKIRQTTGDNPEMWPLDECKGFETPDPSSSGNSTDDQLSTYLSTVIPQNVLDLTVEVAAMRASPNIPFFLYSGSQDGFVPQETFSDEVNALGRRVSYTNFPNSGHEGFYTEAKVWIDLLNDKP